MKGYGLFFEAFFAPWPEVAVGRGELIAVAENTVVSPANAYGFMDGGMGAAYAAVLPRWRLSVYESFVTVRLVELHDARLSRVVIAPGGEVKLEFAHLVVHRLEEDGRTWVWSYDGYIVATGCDEVVLRGRVQTDDYVSDSLVVDGAGGTCDDDALLEEQSLDLLRLTFGRRGACLEVRRCRARLFLGEALKRLEQWTDS